MLDINYIRAGVVVWAIRPSVEVFGAQVVYVEGHRVGYARDASTALAMVRHHRGLS